MPSPIFVFTTIYNNYADGHLGSAVMMVGYVDLTAVTLYRLHSTDITFLGACVSIANLKLHCS